ncbi:MAG TPA: IS701 family transposase [Streptosporangiaceae bacterium]|nr:IS701 family transposase [Streptosporangiaceae bacterium]
MKTTKPKAAAAARIGAGLGRRKRAELLELLRPCFARVEPWLQAGKYAAALMSDLPRRNGWTLAERAGDRTPDRMQRLLSRAVWDTAAAMRVVRRFAVAGLDQAARTSGRRGLAVGAIDETSQVKQGERTAGVKRHYLGCAGKVANGITTVHLAYAREGTGHALIAARQWIPREHLDDPGKRQVMKLPPELAFRTKGQLAIDLIGEVFADGIRFDFACGDEVYGSCTQLRQFLEDRGQAYVLRVPSNFYLTAAPGVRLTCKQAAAALAGARRGWEVRPAGTGAKGQRWYAWAWLATASPRHYLLIRRHLASGELAFHYCFVPDGQPVSLPRLARAAGCRWPVEENFRSGKGCFGLDESQARLFTAIIRHTVLVMAALAVCAVTAALLRRRTDTRAPAPVRPDQPPPPDPGMIPLTVPETARLLAHPPPPGAATHWQAWRRRHQALSTWYHQRARLPRAPEITLVR